MASPLQHQRVGAVAAIDIGEVEAAQADHIIARTAPHHVIGADAGETVLARIAGEIVRCACASLGHGDQTLGPGRPAIDHIAGPGAVSAIRIGARRPDNQIVESVAIDIPRAADREPDIIIRHIALDHKTLVLCQGGKRDIGQPDTTIDHKSFPGTVATDIAAVRADDEIVEPVAIDIARRRHRIAGLVKGHVVPQGKALGGCQRVQIDIGQPGATIDHIGRPGIGAVVIGTRGANDHIVEPVTIHIPR